MARKPKDPNACKCIDAVNAALEPAGVCLSTGFNLSGQVFPILAVESLTSQRPTSKKRVTCTFCPFCGVELRIPTRPATSSSKETK